MCGCSSTRAGSRLAPYQPGQRHAEVTLLLPQQATPPAGPTPPAAALAAALDCVRLCIDANADVERVGDSGLSLPRRGARWYPLRTVLLEAGAEVPGDG